MRIWFKMMKNNHLLRDTTITDESDETRTHKVFHALEEVCYEFDLGKPIWLEANVNEFKRHAKTRFTQDSFIEQIDFDLLSEEETAIMCISNEQCQNRNSKNCLLAEHIFAGTILIGRLTGSPRNL